MIKVQTLKGFRDFLPEEAKKRQYVLNTLNEVFESYGFDLLETPSVEYEEVLTGKYGDEGEKLMYKFTDNGERKVALRYDQTVPLARVVSQYQNKLAFPFKRYQVQNVWRAENTQKGRYREFLQVDIDIVGTLSPLSDVEILQIIYDTFKKLKLDIKIKINDSSNLKGVDPKYLRIIDKLNKVGEEKILEELKELNAEDIYKKIISSKPTDKILSILEEFKKMGYSEEIIEIDNTLVRGLEYYTGIIIEVVLAQNKTLSLGGGGRYDNLIGIFSGKDIPAVGFSFGFDRIVEAIEELNLFPQKLTSNNVFVAFLSSDLQEKALEITKKLRENKINAEFYLEDTVIEKQLKYADKKKIPFSIIISEKDLVLKDMNKRTQETLSLPEIINKLKN